MTPISKALRMTCVWTIVLLIPPASTAQNSALQITVVSGEDATHPAGAHVAKPITIEVTDATGQPVEGARTSFQLPEEGPGGLLASGLRTDLAVTDSHGRATLRGFQLNRSGPLNVRVTVAKEQARAGIVVRQHIWRGERRGGKRGPDGAAFSCQGCGRACHARQGNAIEGGACESNSRNGQTHSRHGSESH